MKIISTIKKSIELLLNANVFSIFLGDESNS